MARSEAGSPEIVTGLNLLSKQHLIMSPQIKRSTPAGSGNVQDLARVVNESRSTRNRSFGRMYLPASSFNDPVWPQGRARRDPVLEMPCDAHARDREILC